MTTRGTTALAILIATAGLTSACGSATNAPSATDAVQSQTGAEVPTKAATVEPPQPVTPTVKHTSVVALPYGLPDTIGFQTAVVATITNPSDQAISGARYDAEVFGANGQSMATSDPSTISLGPHETRTVVITEIQVEVPGELGGDPGETERAMKQAPKRAVVTAYASEPTDATVTPATQWTASRAKVNCNTAFVGCEVSGRLTWTGAGSAEGPITIFAVVRDKPNGKVIAAGTGVPEVQTFPSGAPQPVKVTVTGTQNTPAGAVVELAASTEAY